MTRFQLLLLLTITIHTITIGQTIDNDSLKNIEWKSLDDENYHIERNKNNTLEYHKLIYSSKQGIFDLIFEQFIWLKSEKAYILTLTCKLNEFEICKKTGEKILQSFKLK